MAACYLHLPITEKQYDYLLSLKSFISNFSYFTDQFNNSNDFSIYGRNDCDKPVADLFYEELQNYIESRGR